MCKGLCVVAHTPNLVPTFAGNIWELKLGASDVLKNPFFPEGHTTNSSASFLMEFALVHDLFFFLPIVYRKGMLYITFYN